MKRLLMMQKMKRLLMILLLGALGCGPDTTESVAALEKLGAQIILMPGQRGGVMVQWSGSGITDAGLVHLKGLTNLKILILADTQVTGAGVAEPKKALPKCRIHDDPAALNVTRRPIGSLPAVNGFPSRKVRIEHSFTKARQKKE